MQSIAPHTLGYLTRSFLLKNETTQYFMSSRESFNNIPTSIFQFMGFNFFCANNDCNKQEANDNCKLFILLQMSLHSYTFNDSKANVKTLLLWWTHFLVVPFFIFIHSLPIFHITAIKLHPGQINLLMLAADLFTRLRSPGFCLLRDCTGGGGCQGVLGLTCRAMAR